MPREKRVHIPYAFYHVMMRGNAKQRIFFENKDYTVYYNLLRQGVERFDHSIHGFCIMSNHVHLLVRAGELPIFNGVHNITSRYAKYLNKKFDVVGHQFQGRYKSCLIESLGYLLNVLKYIHLNPVDAHMVDAPQDYSHSSHSCYSHKNKREWIQRDFILSLFANKFSDAVLKYLDFMDIPLDNSEIIAIEKNLNDIKMIHNDEILTHSKHIATVNHYNEKITINEIINKTCEAFEIDEMLIRISSQRHDVCLVKATVAMLVNQYQHLTLADLANSIGLSACHLSRQARMAEKKCLSDESFREKLFKLINNANL